MAFQIVFEQKSTHLIKLLYLCIYYELGVLHHVLAKTGYIVLAFCNGKKNSAFASNL